VPERSPRSGSRTLAAALAVVLLITLAAPAQGAIRSARSRYPAAIEPLAGYQGQTTCSPRAKPGVVDLSRRVLRAFPSTRSLGIVRGCSVGGRSEHKEGRAWDWGGLNAKKKADRLRVQKFKSWLLKKDRHGNRWSRARRLGIQYVIWNKRIWGSYAASSGWRRYTGANPHTDHVHISFTWAGARKKTSFWTGRPGNVFAAPRPTTPPAPPAPKPTKPAPSTSTPRPEPRPDRTLLEGPELVNETVTLPARSGRVRTAGALRSGTPYLVEVSGRVAYRARAGARADAECSRTPGDSTWRRDRSVDRRDPGGDHLDVYVDGTDLQAAPDAGDSSWCDRANHTYRWMYTPVRDGRVRFRIWEPGSFADNSGALTVRVIRSTARDAMSWSVPAASPTGRTSPGALQAGATYLATVSGTVDAGNGVSSDAECSATGSDPVWRRYRSVDSDRSDDLDVLVDGRDVSGQPVDEDRSERCDSTSHTYRFTVGTDTTRPVNLRIADPRPGDNRGRLRVRLVREEPVTGPETVAVDTAKEGGTLTARSYRAGTTLRLTATGTWRIRPGVTADAECSATTSDPVWRVGRSILQDRYGRPGEDLTVDGKFFAWRAASDGDRCSPTAHSYVTTYQPAEDGPLRLRVFDEQVHEHAGTLTVTVEPVG
jgi:hypothetical protein